VTWTHLMKSEAVVSTCRLSMPVTCFVDSIVRGVRIRVRIRVRVRVRVGVRARVRCRACKG
jgi:hypothetical protein